MTLKQRLLETVRTLTKEQLEFKGYGKAGRQMATTRTINVQEVLPVPGQPGKVARAQVTFCVNFMDIATQAQYDERKGEQVDNALDQLDPEQKRALAERLLAEIAGA